MARKSKVENSEHFNEIVDLLLSGFSGRHVSDYLLNEYDEKISHAAITRYKNNHLNVNAEVKKKLIHEEKKKLQKKKKATAKEVSKELIKDESISAAANIKYKDVKILDDLITDAKNIKLNLDGFITDEVPHDPYKEEKLKMDYKKLGLQAIKVKHDILKDDNTLDVNINHGLSDLFDEEDILRFIDESEIVE